jgi:hypothetical protein
MGWNNDSLPGISPIVVDLETVGIPNAADYLEPVLPAKNLVDPIKIKADIEKRTAERDERLALDWNVGRIAAIGWWTDAYGLEINTCEADVLELGALALFWKLARNRTIVGFNVKGFDLRFMVRRSQLLGVPYPQLDFGKYSRKGIHDLYLDLTFGDGTYDQGAMRRTLHAFCKRFGIPVNDPIKGADIPALVAAGEWEKVAAHVRSDVELEVALARKLGVLPAISEPAEVF